MPRSFSQDLYVELLAGKSVRIPDITQNEYNSLRVALYRNHTPLKELGGVADELSIVASYSPQSQEAFFRLAPPTRKKMKEFTIEIVEPPS